MRYDIDANELASRTCCRLQVRRRMLRADRQLHRDTSYQNPTIDLKARPHVMLRFELKHIGEFNYKTDHARTTCSESRAGGRSLSAYDRRCAVPRAGAPRRPAGSPSAMGAPRFVVDKSGRVADRRALRFAIQMTSRGMRSEMTLARHFSRPCGIAAHHAACWPWRARRAGESDRCRAGAAGLRLAADGHRRTGAKQPGKQSTAPRRHAASRGGPDDDAKATRPRRARTIVVLVNDEPITGYEIERARNALPPQSPEVQQRLKAKVKARRRQRPVQGLRARERLQADPAKTEAEQQARVKQLQEAVRRKPERQSSS